ncbi:MAG TPA: DUF6524 family protein [Methylococcaceae bacterium]|jgi:hypothetical protein|nr:DUF6524 family protein [Methylococcaceae bacterium]
MQKDQLTWIGLVVRWVVALGLVYATYNPEGYSYFHWLIHPAAGQSAGVSLANSTALKFLAGVVLLTGWVVYLNATRHALGFLGVLLTVGICAGLIWLLVEWNVFSADNLRVLTHLSLIVASIVLAMGMSWSHISRRLSGQVDTDEVG